MKNKILLALTIIILAFNQLKAQNIQSAHQLTQNCYVTTEGKVVVDAGGHYTTNISEQVYLRDSLHGSTYDTTANTFKNNKKFYYSYDDGGLLTESNAETIDKSGLSWTNSQKISFGYTGFQLHEETTKSWNKAISDWINFLQNKYSYESDNSLSSIFYLNWDSTNIKWDYSTKDLLLYDQSNNVISIANQKWNNNLSSWENYLRINLTYSGGYITNKYYQVWNKSSQLWEDYQRETFTYSSNKKSEVIKQVKSATTDWENYSRSVFVYENSILSNITEYSWNGTWTDNRKYVYTYNSNYLITNVIVQLWAAHLSTYRNLSQDESYYSQREVIGIEETPANMLLIKNPVSRDAGFQITGLKENTKYQMKIVSLNGSVIMNKPVSAGQIIELGSQIQTGVYMLSVSAPGNKTLNQKILIND
jgi:hypothetical protein